MSSNQNESSSQTPNYVLQPSKDENVDPNPNAQPSQSQFRQILSVMFYTYAYFLSLYRQHYDAYYQQQDQLINQQQNVIAAHQQTIAQQQEALDANIIEMVRVLMNDILCLIEMHQV